MMIVDRRSCIWLLLIGVLSCSPFRSKELVPLPIFDNKNLLDSSQAQIVFNYSKYFPNETELDIAIITSEDEKYVGIKRRNDSLVYVDNCDKVFEIGSITKTLTATILAKFVYDGKVDLNEPIKNILPVKLHQSALNGKEMTLLYLANHTSGLPFVPDNLSTDWAIPGSPYQHYDTAQLYDYLSNRLVLQCTPGDKRVYSNLGGGLLGHLLTLISKKSYEDLLFESICKPLGLHNTFVKLNEQRRRELVPGRDPKGQIVPNWNLGVLAGAGEVKSSVRDISRYIIANMNDTTYFLLTLKPTIDYAEHVTAGLGWAWYNNNGKRYVDAYGGTGGYSCGVIFERSDRNAVILLTNVSAFLASKGEYISRLCRELYDSIPSDAERK